MYYSSSETQSFRVRIFLSDWAANDLRPGIAQLLGSRPFRIVTPPEAYSSDFEVALISRDVTARSTKMRLETVTQDFHDALRQAKSLRWVQIHSAGADRPIYPELMARGVTVTTATGSNAIIVAHTALAGVLALARKLPLLAEQQLARQWRSLIMEPPRDLAGQSAVVMGWGPIGQLIAQWLEAIGLRVRVVRNSVQPAAAYPTSIYEQLRDTARDADWLVIACPLSERTWGLVDKEILTAMAQGSHVVNVGRGEIVVEADLIAALQQGPLGGAFLDVFEQEPLPVESPLWSLPNVIVTPHSAGHSEGNEERVAALFLENLERFVEGKPLLRTAGRPV